MAINLCPEGVGSIVRGGGGGGGGHVLINLCPEGAGSIVWRLLISADVSIGEHIMIFILYHYVQGG